MDYENDRSRLLDEAKALINGPRQETYGTPEQNFQRIADRWSQYLGGDISPYDVCIMMAELKLARLANGRDRDGLRDACGYLALAAEIGNVTD